MSRVQNWTDAQRAAIEDEGGALLVSAAAGSGKTAVLVERAVRLITRTENPIPADSLLIVTFTNAAAEELRSRIGQRLEAELRARPGDLGLRRQRMLLRRAFIGTIDAFCGALVREHFNKLDLPPDVAVGDEALLELLAANAMADTMEALYAGDEGFAAFSALYGRARSDAAAEALVRELYEFTRTLPYPERHLAAYEAAYRGTEPLAETPWGQELLAYAKRGLEAATGQAAAAIHEAADDEALLGYLPALGEDEALVAHLLGAVEAKEWDAACALVHGYKFPALRAVRGYEGYAKKRVQALRENVKSILGDLKKNCFGATTAQFEEDRRAAAPHVAALCRAAALFGEKYLAAKLAERVLDFSDFEQLALRLLQNEDGTPTETAKRVSARYSTVMVDEYQDTNELQSALYECLAAEDGANLFYVGDVKQSIYRFRKANPGIFLAKKAAWHPHESGQHPAVLRLPHNFRSGYGVVEGVNFVFRALMSPALGDIAYTGEECLVQGSEGGAENGFALHILEDAVGAGDAAFVAEKIRSMVAEGYRVRVGEGTRPCTYGDFCILLRARKNMQGYAAALEALGIPAVADISAGLLDTPEVLPLASMLCAIDNPADDVSLAATMMGPFFGFTAAEMAALRCADKRGSLWGTLVQSGDAKAQNCAETLRFYRTLAGGMSAGRLCEEIVGRTGYLSAISAMEGGAARRDNLLRFTQWAQGVSANGRGGLGAFVRLIQNGKSPAEGPAKSVPGHVSILTIHKSKGLEFPVCILADAAHSFNRSDRAARVGMHSALGLGPMLREGDVLYHTLPSLAIRGRSAAEAMSEEMRVLYVALTRAKDKLIITFPHKNPEKLLATRAAELAAGVPDPFLLARADSFASWLVSAALCHPGCEPLLEYTGGVIPPRLPAAGGFAMCVEPALAAGEESSEAYRITAAPDEALAASIRAGFGKAGPRERLAGLPRKMSVSALAKQEGAFIPKRPSLMYKSGLSAAERGTAQHTFMQFADFGAAKQDAGAEAARLVREGFLAPALVDALDYDGVAAFLASPLYARIEGAGRVLREYDFITAIPAGTLDETLPPQLAGESVLLQGIADLVLVTGGEAEIVDYKTDKGAQPSELRRRYTGQLQLYRTAVQKRLGLPVTRLTIWSFALHEAVSLPTP